MFDRARLVVAVDVVLVEQRDVGVGQLVDLALGRERPSCRRRVKPFLNWPVILPLELVLDALRRGPAFDERQELASSRAFAWRGARRWAAPARRGSGDEQPDDHPRHPRGRGPAPAAEPAGAASGPAAPAGRHWSSGSGLMCAPSRSCRFMLRRTSQRNAPASNRLERPDSSVPWSMGSPPPPLASPSRRCDPPATGAPRPQPGARAALGSRRLRLDLLRRARRLGRRSARSDSRSPATAPSRSAARSTTALLPARSSGSSAPGSRGCTRQPHARARQPARRLRPVVRPRASDWPWSPLGVGLEIVVGDRADSRSRDLVEPRAARTVVDDLDTAHGAKLAVFAVAASLVAPVCEELLFRGLAAALAAAAGVGRRAPW